jgi:hypothetical protein
LRIAAPVVKIVSMSDDDRSGAPRLDYASGPSWRTYLMPTLRLIVIVGGILLVTYLGLAIYAWWTKNPYPLGS